jgi:hypothetical protein
VEELKRRDDEKVKRHSEMSWRVEQEHHPKILNDVGLFMVSCMWI